MNLRAAIKLVDVISVMSPIHFRSFVIFCHQYKHICNCISIGANTAAWDLAPFHKTLVICRVRCCLGDQNCRYERDTIVALRTFCETGLRSATKKETEMHHSVQKVFINLILFHCKLEPNKSWKPYLESPWKQRTLFKGGFLILDKFFLVPNTNQMVRQNDVLYQKKLNLLIAEQKVYYRILYQAFGRQVTT